jgi:hemolysin activation/secretion protein
MQGNFFLTQFFAMLLGHERKSFSNSRGIFTFEKKSLIIVKIASVFFMLTALQFVLPQHAFSQVPDAGALQQQLQREIDISRPQFPSEEITPQKQEKPAVEKKPDGQKILVKSFVVTGTTLITESQAQAALKNYTDRELTLDQIREAANAVAALYQKIGRTAQAVLPPQDVVDGVIKIQIVEGRMGDAVIEFDDKDPARLKSSVIENFIYHYNAQGSFVDLEGLERSLILLNELPGTQVQGELTAGTTEGSTNIVAKARDMGWLNGRIDATNYGSASTGVAQGIASLSLNNPFKAGDQFTLDAIGSEGSIYAQLKYIVPVGYNGWRVGAGISALSYNSLASFSDIRSLGNSQVYGLYSTYALTRSATVKQNLSINFENKNYLNTSNGIEASNYQLNNLSAGINGSLLGEGYTAGWGGTLTVGNLSINNTTQLANDQNGAATQGYFAKLGLNASYSRPLPIEKTDLSVSAYGQLANKNLNSAEQIYLGGPYAVRAYPVAQGGGAQGAVASIELTHNLLSELQIGAFFDAGLIQQYVNTYSNWQGLTNADNLYPVYGTGLLAKYSYERLQLQAAVAYRIGANPLYNQTGQQLNVDNQYKQVQFWLKGSFFF